MFVYNALNTAKEMQIHIRKDKVMRVNVEQNKMHRKSIASKRLSSTCSNQSNANVLKYRYKDRERRLFVVSGFLSN